MTSVESNSVTLAWTGFKFQQTDGATVNISAYLVESLSDQTNANWITSETIPVTKTNEYSVVVQKLQPRRKYKFRVVIVWLNSNKPQSSLPGRETDWVEIACVGMKICLRFGCNRLENLAMLSEFCIIYDIVDKL